MTKPRRTRVASPIAATALMLCLCIARPAQAYTDYVPLMATGAWQANSASYMKTWRRYVDAREVASPAARPTVPGAPTVVPGATQPSKVPAELAAAYPAAQRAQIEQAFRELLAGWPKMERQFGIPRDDMAGAVAALIAGSWMALHGSDFPDAHFKPLVQQMRGILAASPGFREAPSDEKRATFDRMVILGTFMATVQMAQKRQPDERIAASARDAARGYLEQFLQTEAGRIELGAQGLRLR